MADGNAPQETPLGAGYETTITRTFKAPPEVLFDCFIQPERLAKWWGPHGCVASEVSADPRPGGLLSLRMTGPGYDHVMGGEYVEVDRPNRIVLLTKAFEAPDGGWGIINRNTITLQRLNDGYTRLHLHVRVDRAEGDLVLGALGGMRAGWGQQLERLGHYTGGGGKMDFEVHGNSAILARAFDHPRERVWQALTEADRFAQWFKLGSQGNRILAWDFRPGGAWKVEQTGADGQVHTFWGEFVEIEAPHHLVLTQGFDAYEACKVTYALKEEWGRTTLIRTMDFPSAEYAQGMVGSGYEQGSAASFEALDELLGH